MSKDLTRIVKNGKIGLQKEATLRELINKAGLWEIAEKEGRLFELPSRDIIDSVGGILYYTDDNEIRLCKNEGVELTKKGLVVVLSKDNGESFSVPVDKWQDGLFLTEDAAKEYLSEPEEDREI